jgi:hypothetical protein
MVTRIRVQLRDGPFHGFEDEALPPLEALVTVRYCANCQRRHIHRAREGEPGPLYLRELHSIRSDAGGVVIYRHVDVDKFILLTMALTEPVTLSAR